MVEAADLAEDLSDAGVVRVVGIEDDPDAFEAATFSPEGVDRERASRAFADAERCLSTPDGGEHREELDGTGGSES